VGILLAFFFLMAGRLIRHRMLIAPDGQWRKHMWLDEIVLAPDGAEAAEKAPKPVLTTPLPINTCSVDSLTLLPGVGPVLAGRIQDIREMGKIFLNAEDLRLVKGIGPALSARLAPLVVFTTDSVPDSLLEVSP
jgi:DNA uptake protein ComE-like DNA-binding protein